MFDIRAPLSLPPVAMWATPAGMIAAALLSLLVDGHTHARIDLDEIDQRLAALKVSITPAAHIHDDAADRLLAARLFALTTGPGAVSDVVVLLQGVAITPTRKAALVSIGGKPPEWLSVGVSRDGVTLMDVQSGKITLDTATGFKEVGLGDTAAAASAPGAVPPPGSPPHMR